MMMSSMVRQYSVLGVGHVREREGDCFGRDCVTVESVSAEAGAVDQEVCFDEDIWDESEDSFDLVEPGQLLRSI